jgi:hypothetical protein
MKSWLQLKTFKNFVEGLSLFPLLFERESIDLPRDQVTSSTGGWLVGKKLDISDPSLAIYIYIIYIYIIYIYFSSSSATDLLREGIFQDAAPRFLGLSGDADHNRWALYSSSGRRGFNTKAQLVCNKKVFEPPLDFLEIG